MFFLSIFYISNIIFFFKSNWCIHYISPLCQ